MSITDIKIGNQLKTGFGIILLLILLLGAISLHQTQEIAQQTSDLYEHPLKVRRALGEIKSSILSLRLEYRNLLIAKTDQQRKDAMVQLSLHQEDAELNFKTLEERYLGPKTDVVAAKKAYIQWITLLNADKELVLSGKTEMALSHLDGNSETSTHREILLQWILTIDKFAQAKGDELFNNSVELKKNLDWQLTLIITGILLLSIIITLVLVRNILYPVNELIRATRLFGEGNTDTRCAYNSQNEFGLLSNSFNNLAETIEEEFVFKDRSVQLNAVMLKGLESSSLLLQVLEPLMKLTSSQIGAIYLLNDNKSHFELLESLGMQAASAESFSALSYEGEFGATLASKQVEHLTRIPEKTNFVFKTVSGEFLPKEIITVPLLNNQEVIAIISLSSLQGYDQIAIRLIHDMQSTLTAWMNAMLANRKIQRMSQSLKTQNIELETQKTELESQTNELFEQNMELEMQKKQIAESNQLKSSFLSNMSHELRTPLNSVIALSAVLNRRLEAKIPEEEYSYLKVIERNGKQLLSLINDILDLSRIEAGYEELNTDSFSMGELITDLMELISPQANDKNIQLIYKKEGELPAISSDYKKCMHILQNIVANAIKFTESGEVVITTKVHADTFQIEVKDTGIGIEKEFLSQIFEEFRQGDGSNARKYGGTGLGLSIAKKYAEFLGGSISVESVFGTGSTFTIKLPIQVPTSKTIREEEITVTNRTKPQHPTRSGVADRNPKTILLVEDSAAIVVQLKEVITAEGYNLLIATNGKEALEQVSTVIPDAIILDLMMPEVDGFEVLRTIREKEATSRIPVIILTAKYVTKEELIFLKHNHVHQLIQKGEINKKQLLDAVSGIFFQSEEEAAPSKPIQPITGSASLTEKPLILVVEDNPDNMITIKALLKDQYSVIEAYDGPTGIALALKQLPHLILMDIALPGINGIETLLEMRKEESLITVPVIAVSASAMKGDKEQFISCGFNDYIPKPIDHELLMQVVNKWI